MAIPKKIIKFLDNNKAKYDLLEHRTVYTAFDKAATLRVPEKTVGKTLVVKLDSNIGFVLIPANKNLDKMKLKKLAKAKSIDFVKELWMKKNLKGVKLGAIPPFGNLWKASTYIEKSLLQSPKIVINAGDYNYSVKITPAVFRKIAPGLIVGNFGKKR